MRAVARAVTALAVVLALVGRAAASSPTQDLATARNDFRAGKHQDAIVLLNYLLYPQGKLANEDDLYEAHLLYGVCLFEIGDNKGATREIEAALFIDSSQRLDDQVFSSEAIKFYNEVKAAKEARDRAAADARAAAIERERLRKAIEDLRVVETRQWWVNLMPFGAGQFQNGDNKKGVFFAATEAAAAGTSVFVFLYLTNKYGYGGQVPAEDAADVRLMQQVAIGADIVFYGVAIVGIVDAIRHYKPRVEVDKSSIPKDLLVPDPDQKTRRKPAPKTTWLVHPIPVRDGAGIGLTWEH